MDGLITQVGPTITLPAFRVVQDGLIYEKTVLTTLSAPALVAPFYLVVSSPTVNQLDDLLFTFAKTPEDLSAAEVILGAYDGQEWRVPDKISIKGLFELLAQINIDTMRVGPFSGLKTTLNGGNYDNSPGTLVDKQGQTQRFESIASFPVVAVDPDWARVDRILYRRPTDSINRVGIREFLLGGTYSASPAALASVQSFNNSKVRQTQRVQIASDNTAHVFSASGSGTVFQLDYTKIAANRLSALVAATTLITGLTSKAFSVAIDPSDNLHVVYVKSGNVFYRKYSNVGVLLVAETVIDSQAGVCDNPKVSIDPAGTKVFIVYQSLMGPSNNQIFFTARTLLGSLMVAPKNLASSAQNLITPDIFVSEDLFVYVAWANQTLGSVLFRRFDDIGDPIDAAATTISTGVVQIGVGTLTGGANSPRILVTGNREVLCAFRQDKGSSVYGLSVYAGGTAFMQELTGPAENFTSFDIATDPIFNSVMFTAAQASSTDFIKIYGQTVAFTLNLAAAGSLGVAVARDRRGSLLHCFAAPASGAFTSYDATTSITAFGAASVVGGITTINVGANQFLVTAASLSQAPNPDDQVVITGSGIGGNNSTRLITAVELMSLNTIDDVYRVTVANNFTAAESPATANGNFQSPNGSSARYRKTVSESSDRVFNLFELPSDILLSRMVAPGTTILNWLPPGSAGDLADFLVIGGSGGIDWEATAAGELTLTGTVKLTNIFTSTVYQLNVGGYPMSEGDALYVPLDDSDLTPTPLVTPIPTLPWNTPIGVIGIIRDGVFEPSMANLNPLVSGEEYDLGQALPTLIRDRLGILTDVTFDPYGSTNHINTGDNYPEAISNLDTAVQNIIGQIFMTPEAPNSKRVKVSGVDKLLLNGSIFGAKYKERLISFDGAVIDFTTGTIYKADGVTALGVNFTPIVPAANTWRWYAVNLLPGTLLADNRLSLTLQVTAASANGASQAAAPRATFTPQPDVGQVAVTSLDGSALQNISAANLVNLVTNFSLDQGSPGADSTSLQVSGNITMDWSVTTVNQFTFAAGLRVQDLTRNLSWLPVAGSYAMAEGDALYIVLNPAALTPTPIVASVGLLPYTMNIFVIGTIKDGIFVPTSLGLKPLEAGEQWVFGNNLSQVQADRAGFPSNVSFVAYPSTESIGALNSYPTAIGNLDIAINQILSQISVYPKSPTSTRVVVSAANKVLLSGTVLGMQVEGLLVDFDGAEIDFQTGTIYAADGVTALGTNFTPVVPGSNLWRWFAINLETAITTAANRITFVLTVTPAASNGASQALAPRAEFDTTPKVSQVAITSLNGTTVQPISYGNIVNLLTLDSGSGGGSVVLKALAGENLTENDLVYLSPGSANGDTARTQGLFYKADPGNANSTLAAIRSQAVGFIMATVLSGATAKAATGGIRKNFVGLTPGIQYYGSPVTPGAITSTKPTTAGQWVVPVGFPTTATKLSINPSISSDAAIVAAAVSSTDINATQTAHGFTLGQLVYFDGTNWALARADSSFTIAEGMVKAVIDANNFTVGVIGPVTGLTGLLAGYYYFASAVTAGAFTTTEPLPPNVSNPIGFALSTTQMMLLPLRASASGGSGAPSNYFTALAGENITAGETLYMSPGNANGDTGRTSGRWYKVDTGNASPTLAAIRSIALGIATSTVLAGASLMSQLGGTTLAFGGLIPGSQYWADPTIPGGITFVRPTTVGQWRMPIGVAEDVNTLYLNPSMGADARIITSSGASAPVVKTANYTIVSLDRIIADTTGGAFTLTLPLSPVVGDEAEVWDGQGTWGTNNLTFARNGSLIGGLAQDFIGNIPGKLQFVYVGGATGWAVTVM